MVKLITAALLLQGAAAIQLMEGHTHKHQHEIKSKIKAKHSLLQFVDNVGDDEQGQLEAQVLEAADKDPELMQALQQAAAEAEAKGVPLDLAALM